MSLDDQNRLRCITQTQKILKNQSSYLTLLDGISPQWIVELEITLGFFRVRNLERGMPKSLLGLMAKNML